MLLIAGAGFFFHLASISEELELPVILLPSCFYLPWACARAASLVLTGYLLDRVPPRYLMFGGFLCGGLSMMAFGWPGCTLTPLRTVLVAALWGLSMGVGKAVFAVCPAQFFGRLHLGAIQGLLQTSNVASTAVGPLIIGVAHDLGRDYSPILLAIAAVNIFIGALGALFLRAPKRRRAVGARALSGDDGAEDSTELAPTASPAAAAAAAAETGPS